MGFKFLNFFASARKENGSSRVLRFAFFHLFATSAKPCLAFLNGGWRLGGGGLQIAREERRGQGLVRRDSRLAGLQRSRPSCRGNKELAAVRGAEINRYLFERQMKGARPRCRDNDAAGRIGDASQRD